MRFHILFFLAPLIALVSNHVMAFSHKDSAALHVRHPKHHLSWTPKSEAERRTSLMKRSAAEREVWYVRSIYAGLGNVALSGPSQGQMVFPIDSAFFFTGTAVDPPLMVNIVLFNGSISVQIYVWNLSSTGSVPSYLGSTPGVIQQSYFLGNTTMTNLDLWNPNGVMPNNSTTNGTTPTNSTTHGTTANNSTSHGTIPANSTSNGTTPTNTTSYATIPTKSPTHGTMTYNATSHWAIPTSSPTHGTITYNSTLNGTITNNSTMNGTLTNNSTTHRTARSNSKLKRTVSPPPLAGGYIAKIMKANLQGTTFSGKFVEEFNFDTANSEIGQSLKEGIQTINADETLDEDFADTFPDSDNGFRTTITTVVEETTEGKVAYILNKDGSSAIIRQYSTTQKTTTFFSRQQTLAKENGFTTTLAEDEITPVIELTEPGSVAAKIEGTDQVVNDGGSAPIEKGPNSLALTQVKGELSATAAIAADVAKALGVLGILAGGIDFMIVLFEAGQYVAGALTAASTAAGVISIIAIDFAPVLAEVLGPLSFLLALLAAAFVHQNPKPPANNATQILQWSWFGDKDSTGNENCQKGSPATATSPGTPPSPNCIALYSASTLAVTLKISNYAATVLSIWANDGYAISIPELAAKVCIMDDTEPNQCANAPFQVNCKDTVGQAGQHGSTIGGTGFTDCYNPTYNVQLNLISLPVLNETADKIETRIIGGPNAVAGADCKIVQFSGAQQFPKYNLTINGMPSGIACGIQNTWNIGGTAVPFDCGNDCVPGSIVSSGGNSTTGGNGAEIAAPPPVPFAVPNNTFACLEVGGPDNEFCLPPMKYDCQAGKAFDITKVDKLALPSGWGMTTYWQAQPVRSPRVEIIQHSYTPTSSQDTLNEDMIGIHNNLYNAASFTITGPAPAGPLVCLFDQTNYNGNVICLGAGGGNLTSEWQNTAQSAKMWGAKTTFYPGFYGNAEGQLNNGDVADLSTLPIGVNENLSKNTYALLIQPAD